MDFQSLIHRVEVGGGGARFFRIVLAVLALLLLLVGYNWRAFRNLSTQEAMDSAQLARNIATGKGYTTQFIRPLSLHLLRERYLDRQPSSVPADPDKAPDYARLKGDHPDLANPPVYPVVLAGLLKVAHLDYQLPSKPVPFWTFGGHFYRYKPDFLIAAFNQALLLGVVVLVYFLARRLLGPTAGWLSAVVVLGTEPFWRYAVSGLSTTLLMLLFLGLVWCLVVLEAELREPRHAPFTLYLLAGLAGLLVGLMGLTRYSLGWLIVPLVLFFILLFSGRERHLLPLTAFAVFAAVMTPWIVRNLAVSGTPLGTATYALIENSWYFPGNRLERSLEPDISKVPLQLFFHKLLVNARGIFQSDLPRLAGSWLSAFFLVGLLVNFRNPAVTRLRNFLLGCLALLVVVQALGKTQLSEDSPDLNSENLLIVVAPLVLVLGVGLFLLLLEQIELPFRELRYIIVGGFLLVACLPMLFVFLPPKTSPLVNPPYNPPLIQAVSGWLAPDELAMSDEPWAVAWYGQRQCVWLTLRALPDPQDPNSHENFFGIYDRYKLVNALYLTTLTLDNRFASQWQPTESGSWGHFFLQLLGPKPESGWSSELSLSFDAAEKRPLYTRFPLRSGLPGLFPYQLVLMDHERWRKQP